MLLKVFSNDQLLAIAFSLAKDTVSAGARSMESQPCFGFAKRSNFCELASFNFNLLYTVGRRDRITLPGRLPGFFVIHLMHAAAAKRRMMPDQLMRDGRRYCRERRGLRQEEAILFSSRRWAQGARLGGIAAMK